MSSKISLLRSNVFKDAVKNPILEAFNPKLVSKDKKKREASLEKIAVIKANEDFLTSIPASALDQLKIYLIQSGMTEFYHDIAPLANLLSERIALVQSRK